MIKSFNTKRNSQDYYRDSDKKLYGIQNIGKFQVENEHEHETLEKELLGNIYWNIQKDPREAANVDLSKKLFHSPIFLQLHSRYYDRSYRVPVFDRTVYNVLAVIHKFYRMYEVTNITDEGELVEIDVDKERETYSMGEDIWFAGLVFVSPGIWKVHLDSC